MAMPMVAPRGATCSPQLTRMECSKRCEGYKYYGMHNGGTCVCSNSEEDGSVGAAAALRREESGDDGGDDEGDEGDGRGRRLGGGDDEGDDEGGGSDDSDGGGTWGFGRFGAVSDPECDAPCTGDSAERCGGVARLSVWRRGGRVGVVLNAGEYKQYDLIFRKLPPRAVEAVELPPGLRMTLYQEDDFGGLSLNVTGRRRACATPRAATHRTRRTGRTRRRVQRARLGRTGGVAQDRIRGEWAAVPAAHRDRDGSARVAPLDERPPRPLPATRRVRSTAGRTSRAGIGTRTRGRRAGR